MNEKYGKWAGKGLILVQSKVNCILAYFLLLCFKQEIYGSVFAVLHYEFLVSVLGLTLIVYLGMLHKAYIMNNFMNVLGSFVCILQKNVSLIVSIIVFRQGINSGQILGVCLIAVTAFVYFLLGLKEIDETSKKSKSRMISNARKSS